MVNTESGTGVRLTITAGASEDWPCLINLEFSRTFHPEFYEHDFMWALIKLLISNYQPHNAFVISHPFWNQIELPPREDEVNSRVEPVGWFTYLANPRANALPPADVEREILPGGGVLISLQQAFPSEDDPAAVAAAIRIRDALQTEDLLRL
ncbi:MAG: Imm52 family immunity protein [Thiolinea sp.]